MLIILLSLSVLGVILNIAFLVISQSRSDITPATHIFLNNLTAANIITCIFCFSWDITADLGLTVWQCVVQYFGVQMTLYVTLGTVTVMGVERLVAISNPFSYKLIFTVAKRRLLLIGTWCLALACCAVTIEDFASGIHGVCSPLELYPLRYGVYVVGCVLFAYLLSQLTANGALIYILLKYSPTINTMARTARAFRATGITLACSVSYTLTVTPMAVFLIYCGLSDQPLEVLLLQPFSIATNAIVTVVTLIDPIIYFVSLFVCRASKRSQVTIIDDGRMNRDPPDSGIVVNTES